MENLERYHNKSRRRQHHFPPGQHPRSRRRRGVEGVGFRARANIWQNGRLNGQPRKKRCGYLVGMCGNPACLRDLEQCDRKGYYYYTKRSRHQGSPPRRLENHANPLAWQDERHDDNLLAPYYEDLNKDLDNSSSHSIWEDISIPSVDTSLALEYKDDRNPRRYTEQYSPRGYRAPGRPSRRTQWDSRQYGLEQGSSDTEGGPRFRSSFSERDNSYPRTASTGFSGSEDSF